MISFDFNDAEHIYTLKNGVEVPGCTRVIDTGGWDTYSNVRQDILEKKSIIGREVHRATCLYDRGILDWRSLDPRIEGYVAGWKYFRDVTKYVPTLTEFLSVAKVHGRMFGLIVDSYGKTKLRAGFGVPTIVEKKCTVAKARRHELQTAGYAIGLGGTLTKSAFARFFSRRRLIVYLKPKGAPEIHECVRREDYDIFMALLTVTDFKLREEKMERDTKW